MSYIVYSLLEASEGEDTVSILIQYAIYILIIVVGIVVLGLIKRRQKPISHDALRKRLVNLSDNIQKAIECIKSEKYGQYDFLRMMQKLIFSADKLIYQSSILADKERDSAISNIAMAVERAKSLLMEFRAEWKIVETEFGFHIIQLIEKRGDRINTRHILLRPKVSDKDLTDALNRLDSIRTDIVANKFSFEIGAQYISQDKNTKNNNGMLVNQQVGGTRFEMSALPQEVAKVVDTLQVNEISKPFIMIDQTNNKEVVAIVKLKKRIEGHKANLSEDYQMIRNMYENSEKARVIEEWIKKTQKETYVRIEEGWRNCEFQYDWLNNN